MRHYILHLATLVWSKYLDFGILGPSKTYFYIMPANKSCALILKKTETSRISALEILSVNNVRTDKKTRLNAPLDSDFGRLILCKNSHWF